MIFKENIKKSVLHYSTPTYVCIKTKKREKNLCYTPFLYNFIKHLSKHLITAELGTTF